MLLPEESHSIQNLASARACSVEALSEVCILTLELFNPLWIELRTARCGFDCLDFRFSLKRPAPKARELVTEMPDELLELIECFDVRTFAV
jgi:hypothetical protein